MHDFTEEYQYKINSLRPMPVKFCVEWSFDHFFGYQVGCCLDIFLMLPYKYFKKLIWGKNTLFAMFYSLLYLFAFSASITLAFCLDPQLFWISGRYNRCYHMKDILYIDDLNMVIEIQLSVIFFLTCNACLIACFYFHLPQTIWVILVTTPCFNEFNTNINKNG